MRERTGPTVPVPAYLIDGVMPALKDTEFRVLIVVARQTLGWKDIATGGRKVRDWLTQSQIKRRTGRAGEAVSNAVDALVQKGLIVVTDARDRPLARPEDRRRHAGRLYYRLSTETLAAHQPDGNRKSVVGKTDTTKEETLTKQ